MNASSFEADTLRALEESRQAIAAFRLLPSDTEFAQVIRAFDRIVLPLNGVQGRVGLFSHVHPDEDMRETAKRLEQAIAGFHTDLSLDREVYDRLAKFESRTEEGPEGRLLEHALRDYRRSGVDRDAASRERIKALSDELVKIGQRFDHNIIEDVREVRVADGHAGLEGLPQDYVAAHPEAEDGSVTITTESPDFVPFMTYAVRDDLRRELFFEFSNRAAPHNLDVLRELMNKRQELATLLGFPDWSSYVAEDKMVKTPAQVQAFIDRVAELARPRMEAEYAELLERLVDDQPGADRVRDWQRTYLAERLKAERYGFDSQSVRPYFSYENVREGVLATSATLYGVEFRRCESEPVWHPSVECYEIVDDSEVVARFFLDMHPREGKYKHAAMFDGASGVLGECIPDGTLVCNFPEPKGDDHALMQHNDVTTFFHEFGHLLHHLFAGRHSFLSFSGIATEWDFVEVPSQMYEEWAWDSGVLAKFARHHETGERIPAELVQRMRSADEYGKGMHVSNQMFYASLALTYYREAEGEIDLMETVRELKESLTPFSFEEGTCFPASFGHLHGYSALYYTYMWSHVIAKDLVSRFEGDLMSGSTAARYRSRVLEPGGAKDAAVLIRDFLGRDFEFAAWERWLQR